MNCIALCNDGEIKLWYVFVSHQPLHPSHTVPVRQAIPIVMGANIGTSVTNTIVALGQAKERNEFRRAFGGATVHDMFNWLTVLIFFPIEIITHYLELMTDRILSGLDLMEQDVEVEILKAVTGPFTKLIVQVSFVS